MSARSSSPVLVTVLDTPAGPLSLLACDDTLVGAGFTGDPGVAARPPGARAARDGADRRAAAGPGVAGEADARLLRG